MIFSSYCSNIIELFELFCDKLFISFLSEIIDKLSTVEQKLSSVQIFLIIPFISLRDNSLKDETLYLFLGFRNISTFFVSTKYLLLTEGEVDKLPH